MKRFIPIVLLLSGCGYAAKNSEFTGQVKYVENRTPLLCLSYTAVGVSLGVMRNGSGSMSTHDEVVTARDGLVLEQLKDATKSGAVVNLTYDVARFRLCEPTTIITAVSVAK